MLTCILITNVQISYLSKLLRMALQHGKCIESERKRIIMRYSVIDNYIGQHWEPLSRTYLKAYLLRSVQTQDGSPTLKYINTSVSRIHRLLATQAILNHKNTCSLNTTYRRDPTDWLSGFNYSPNICYTKQSLQILRLLMFLMRIVSVVISELL